MESRILVIDDSWSSSQKMAAYMTILNIPCDFAEDYCEAKDLIGFIEYRIIIINTDSEGYDYLKLLDFVQNHSDKRISYTPILALTKHCKKFEYMNFDGTVDKNVDLEDFSLKLSDYMDLKSLASTHDFYLTA